MTLSALLVFCVTYALSAATPGPSMAALMARVVACGLRGSPAFIAGFIAGDLIWYGMAATGLVLMAKTLGPLFIIIKYAGVAYLLYLAYKLLTSRSDGQRAEVANTSENPVRLFFGAIAITLGNPNVIVFFMALLPTVVDLELLGGLGFLQLGIAITVVLTMILTGYALAAAQARVFISSPKVMNVVNQLTGAVMVGVAMMVAIR